MKLKNTLMIAALIAGSMLAADYAVRAQDSTNTPPAVARPPVARGARSLEAVATQLALTDDQKTKFKPVYAEMMQKMMDLRKDTTLDAAARRTKVKEIRDNATTKLKEILTPEQLDKWQKLGPAVRPKPAAGTNAPATPTEKPPQ